MVKIERPNGENAKIAVASLEKEKQKKKTSSEVFPIIFILMPARSCEGNITVPFWLRRKFPHRCQEWQ